MLLCRTELDRLPVGIRGVYLLHSFSALFGGYPVFYAGRSGDLRHRLAQHLDDTRAKRTIRIARGFSRTYFSAAPVADLAVQRRVEAALIRLLRPVCNDLIPLVEPILVNLPPLYALAPGAIAE